MARPVRWSHSHRVQSIDPLSSVSCRVGSPWLLLRLGPGVACRVVHGDPHAPRPGEPPYEPAAAGAAADELDLHVAPGPWYRDRGFRWVALVVVVVALSVRAVTTLVAYQDLPLGLDDNFYYHEQARLLAEGEGYANPFVYADTGELVATAQHPPLYSTYLAAATVLGADTPLAHRLASALLGVATALVLALLARRLGGNRAGLLAGLIAAVYPNLWINDGLILSESLYALTIAVLMWAAYALWLQPRVWRAAVLGAAISIATLTRSEAVALFAFLAPPLILWLGGLALRVRLRYLLVCGLAGLAVLSPWMIRNLLSFDEPVLLSSGSGYVLDIANCDTTYSGEYLGYWHTDCGAPSWPAGDESVIEAELRADGIGYITAHLSELPVVLLARTGRLWDLYRPFQGVELNTFFERRGEIPSWLGLFMYWVLLPATVYGLVVCRRRSITIIPPIALALMVTMTAAMAFGITRYRVPVDVALALFAGLAFDAVLNRMRSPRIAAAS